MTFKANMGLKHMQRGEREKREREREYILHLPEKKTAKSERKRTIRQRKRREYTIK